MKIIHQRKFILINSVNYLFYTINTYIFDKIERNIKIDELLIDHGLY